MVYPIARRNPPQHDLGVSENMMIGLATLGAATAISTTASMANLAFSAASGMSDLEKINETNPAKRQAKVKEIRKKAEDRAELAQHIINITPGALFSVLGAVALFKDDNKDVGVPAIVGGVSSIATNYILQSMLKKSFSNSKFLSSL